MSKRKGTLVNQNALRLHYTLKWPEIHNDFFILSQDVDWSHMARSLHNFLYANVVIGIRCIPNNLMNPFINGIARNEVDTSDDDFLVVELSHINPLFLPIKGFVRMCLLVT